MSNWGELTDEEKRGKWKNLEETKGTLFLFRHHDGSYVTGRHQKYAEIIKNPHGEDFIILEDAQGHKSVGRPLSDFDVSLPPFEKETLQQEYERTKLKPEADGSVHFVTLPPFEEWKRLKEVGLMGGGGARKRKTRKKRKRKIKKRKTRKRKIKKRKARKRKTRKRFRNRRRKR